MRVLFVAHPDDELIWFRPEEYDEIHIFFGENQKLNQQRINAYLGHPLKNAIKYYHLPETGSWKSKTLSSSYFSTQYKIREILRSLKTSYSFIATHGPKGEYNHPEHILIHQEVVKRFKSNKIHIPHPSKKRARSLSSIEERIYQNYKFNKCWTWGRKNSLSMIPYLTQLKEIL